MEKSYQEIYFHFVVVTKGRQKTISEEWEHRLYKYISGFVAEKGHKLYCINGMPDHIHMLISFSTTSSVSEFIREFKKATNKFINEHFFKYNEFKWQSGYCVKGCSKSILKRVIRYIENQKIHHKSKTLSDEGEIFGFNQVM